MNKKNRAHLGLQAFTLIELLVVIAIIGILIGILTPALKGAIDRARKTRVQTEVNSIATAVQAYANEYGMMPVEKNMQGNRDDSAGDLYSASVVKDILTALTGQDDQSAKVRNPRKIVFLDMTPDSSGNFLDIWDRAYLLKCDTDYNNRIKYKGTNYNRVVIVWSDGPSKDTDTDDILSTN